MDLRGKRVLVLGGAGEVGFAVCHELMKETPALLVIASLKREEAEEAAHRLRKEFPQSPTEIEIDWGNVFVREALKDKSRSEILRTPQYLEWLIEDILYEFNEDILRNSTLYRMLERWRPHVLIDSINTATALAYQDIYKSAHELKRALDAGGPEQIRDTAVRLLATLYTPQLVRHIQILNEAVRRLGVQVYAKVGTTGTGGMGLNIPYTHGEERPSRVLLSKSAMGGAHTMLLFLMARTPGGPVVKEFKPAALIAWKRIEAGPVYKAGRPIRLYDCPPEEGRKLQLGETFQYSQEKRGKPLGDRVLESVFVDTGENGVFSLEEFKAITSLRQMEYITPEEIAEAIVFEIKGGNTAKDVINALDGAVMGPTYRAGLLRNLAIQRMVHLSKEHPSSPAFEILGPPRLSKLLFEAHLLREAFGTMERVLRENEEMLAETLDRLIRDRQDLRAQAISVGIPILMSDGATLLFARRDDPPGKDWERDTWRITPEEINRLAEKEWIDLRPANMGRWKSRFQAILEEAHRLSCDTGSRCDRGLDFWSTTPEGEHWIDPGEVVGYIFTVEDQGARMKR